ANIPSGQPLKLEVDGGQITGTKPLNDGLWHHVAIVIANPNGSTDINIADAKLWVDGQLDPITSTVRRAISTGSTLIPSLGGSNHHEGYNFTGKLDDLRIFDRALSDAELQALYLRRPIYFTAPAD